MRKWSPVALIVAAVGWFILNNVGSSLALSDAAARPVTALSRDGVRITVRPPQGEVAEGQAELAGGTGIQFGYSFVYKLPDDALVTCNHRFRSVSCDSGWQPERAPPP